MAVFRYVLVRGAFITKMFGFRYVLLNVEIINYYYSYRNIIVKCYKYHLCTKVATQ